VKVIEVKDCICTQYILDMTPKLQETIVKKYKMYCIKLKDIVVSMDIPE
jgi:hypothetical protein